MTTEEIRSRVRTVVIGFGGAVLGAVMGLLIGANIGGNWFTSLSIAGQNGYEATAMLGALAGGLALGIGGVWLDHRRQPGARRA